MQPPIIPPDENERLAVLRAYDVLDTPAEDAFDDLTLIASRVCQTPIALVSLVDVGRQWFKSKVGLSATETPRDVSFCGHAILGDDLFEVSDSSADPRFVDNPLAVGAPHVRFYAGTPLKTPGGQRIGTLCVIDHVSRTLSDEQRDTLRRLGRQVVAQLELRAAARRIEERGNLNRAMVDNAVDAIISIDEQGIVLSANPATQRIFGYAPAEIVGQNIKIIMPEPHRGEHDGYMTRYRATGEKRIIGIGRDVFGRRKDGSIFPLRLGVSENSVSGKRFFTGVISDITDRVAAEAKLAEFNRQLVASEERAERAQRIANAGVFERNLRTEELYWSKQLRRIVGFEDADGTPSLEWLYRAVHPEDVSPFRQKINQSIADGALFDQECRIVHKDGSIRWIRVVANGVTGADGTVEWFVGLAFDATEAVERRRQLIEARAAAEAASRAKTSFLSSMSHELRTPLNAVVGFAQLLGADPGLSSDQQENIDEIRKGGMHLLNLINDILDLAKIEANQFDFSPEPVDLAALVEESVRLLKPQATKRKIRIEVDTGSLAKRFVTADRVRVKQALLNYMSNAVKYNQVDGKIRVYAEPLKSRPDFLRVNVQDMGLGIATADFTRLFQVFSRLGEENSNIEGTGIGLAITKRLIEAMGGTVGLQSVVGLGSTFWFELPLSAAPPATRIVETPNASAPPKTPAVASANQRDLVLYVEDNLSNIQLMQGIFRRLPHLDLLTATSGREGLAKIEDLKPKLVLLDINMPGLDGYGVLREIRNRRDRATLPVIAVTAKAMREDVEHGKTLGFDAYLTKPLDVVGVVATVQRHLPAP